MDESESPRGRVGMARALAEGRLAASAPLVEHEMNCLVCDACSAVCPAGVHMDPLQVVLRSALESSARRSWRERLVRRFVFGWLFMDMARFRLLARLLWLYQRLGARWLARRLGILQFIGLDAAERLLPEVPARFLVPHGETHAAVVGADGVHLDGSDAAQAAAGGTAPAVGRGAAPAVGDRAPAVGDGAPAAFFAGCVMSTALADVDRATVRVLQRAGYAVRDPAEQGCCGALHAHGGDLPRALQLAQANIAAFERSDGPIVVNSAGCGAMLKDYAHHLADDAAWAERARAFSARVRDLSEVLADRPLPINHENHERGESESQNVVYQDACHLLHAQRISRQPRDLLKRIPGVTVCEIEEASLCCGSAGVYNLTNPVESRQLQQRKLDHALAANPALIVTTNPGCLLQLQSGLTDRGSPVPVKHLAQVLDEATAP